MNEIKQNHHPRGDPNNDNGGHGHRPYWTRAHRDWRVWVGVVLMLVAMMIYLMTGDLRWRIQAQPQQPQPISVPAGN